MAHPMRDLIEIVIIGSQYMICMRELQLAQVMRVSVEIVAVSSDYA